MGFEPVLVFRPPLRLAWIEPLRELVSVYVVFPLVLLNDN